MSVAILDYQAGNLLSVSHALARLGADCFVTDSPEEIRRASKVIVPGVGEASSAMRYLKVRSLDKLILSLTQPVLGICLGLQLFCESSEEGDVDCLGIFPNRVRKFRRAKKIPHMGWNTVAQRKPSKLLSGLEVEPYLYFVHSYFAELSEDSSASCDYEEPFSAALERDNFFALQFHPERSGKAGEQILKNFLELD